MKISPEELKEIERLEAEERAREFLKKEEKTVIGTGTMQELNLIIEPYKDFYGKPTVAQKNYLMKVLGSNPGIKDRLIEKLNKQQASVLIDYFKEQEHQAIVKAYQKNVKPNQKNVKANCVGILAVIIFIIVVALLSQK